MMKTKDSRRTTLQFHSNLLNPYELTISFSSGLFNIAGQNVDRKSIRYEIDQLFFSRLMILYSSNLSLSVFQLTRSLDTIFTSKLFAWSHRSDVWWSRQRGCPWKIQTPRNLYLLQTWFMIHSSCIQFITQSISKPQFSSSACEFSKKRFARYDFSRRANEQVRRILKMLCNLESRIKFAKSKST